MAERALAAGSSEAHSLRYAVYSVVAIVIAMIFLFPLYWAV